MKCILFFGHRPYPNDHAVLESVFTHRLPERGYQIVWVLQPRTQEHSGIQADWNGTPVYVTRRRWWRGIPRHMELFLEFLRLGSRALREYQVDIVQARNGIPEGLAAWLLAKRHGKRFVFQYSFSLTYNRRANFQKTRFAALAGIVYRIQFWLIRFLMQQADLVLAISDQMRDEWQAAGISHIMAFPLGAEVEPTPGEIVPIEAPPETVIYFGTMENSRKLTSLLDVFALVLERLPSAHLLMLGEATGSGLPEYAEQLGISHAVTFTGRVPRKEVPRYVRAARCSIALYPPEQPFLSVSPIKVMESLALAVPVVGNSEIRDLREVIEQSGGGYTPPYICEALAESILTLLTNPQDALRRGQLGREYIVRERSYAVLSERLIENYENVLQV